jgi:hypothetical protein
MSHYNLIDQSVIRRFWDNTDYPKDWQNHPEKLDKCWLSKRARDKDGYAYASIKRITTRAHRLSYMIHYGPIPNGMLVCHTCDNPPCVNPNHLYLGNPIDNTQDMISKGRKASTKGELNGTSILTDDEIIQIISDIQNFKYKSYNQIMKAYNCSRLCIYQILHRTNWTHITKNYSNQVLDDCKLILNRRLPEHVVTYIKNELNKGTKQIDISKATGVHKGIISEIKLGRRYK